MTRQDSISQRISTSTQQSDAPRREEALFCSFLEWVRVPRREPPDPVYPPTPADPNRPLRRSVHPQVRRALSYIEDHLSDAGMNVGSVARVLGMNATYLSHIFAGEMKVRMSRHIADQRIRLAKELLATTDWQIKRVAFESGHSNADWFSQVFHAHAGMTPCDYRRQVRTVAR